jgi:hypothetical protein
MTPEVYVRRSHPARRCAVLLDETGDELKKTATACGLLIADAQNVVAQEQLFVRLCVEECAREVARMDDGLRRG